MTGGERLGLFGGSFNPPHVGHLIVAETAREALGLDAVVWMPAFVSPFKQGRDTPDPAHRLEMVRRATAGNPGFRVSTLELDRGGVSYTADTLHRLHAEHAHAEWTLLMGGDSLASLPRWREPETILALARIAVYGRPGATYDALPADWLARVTRLDAPLLHISSTLIRERALTGRSLRYLVPDAVGTYITKHGLYAD